MKTPLILFVFLIASCKTNQQVSSPCPPYFKYDQIEHYALRGDADSISQTYERYLSSRNSADQKFIAIVMDNSAVNKIADTIKLKDLASFGFIKGIIPTEKFNAIDELFCFNRFDEREMKVTLCDPEYRDILIFKQGNKTIGYARLCLECSKSNIVGSNHSTSAFGQLGEYEKLEELLHVELPKKLNLH